MKGFFVSIKEIIGEGGLCLLLFLIMLYSCTWYSNSIYYCAPFLALLLFSNIKNIRADIIGKLLLAFSVTFVLMLFASGQVATNFGTLGVLCGPTACYLYGKRLTDKFKGDGNVLNTLMMLCVLIFVLRLGLITLENISTGDLVNLSRMIDQDRIFSATLCELTVSVAMGGVAIFFAMPDRFRSPTSWGYAIAFVLSVLTVVHLVSRSGLVSALGTFVVVLVYLSKLKPGKLFLYLLVVIGVVFLALRYGLISEDVFSAYEKRADDDLLVYGADNARFAGRGDRWIDSLSYIFTHPFGWSTDKSLGVGYSHNLWLDIARQCGIIPFSLFLFATVNIVKIFIRIFRSKSNDTFLVVLIAEFVCITLGCFVEPVIEGNAFVLYFYTFVWGIMVRYEQLHYT